ncbi:hypothetical protein KUTeg_007406 [Tegillarca granosa]|uniref:Peptidase M24 domain-containing protein n=1 Tax=Tegillarca granosa TaxID=220873 RepID=A0ABQ9FF58_TEGGR|nr:hypothetical protein KUTeg_007406 [Tegillarca granosa]
MFNLRGSDFTYFPGFYSHAIVERTQNFTRLYIHDHVRKLTENPTDNMTFVTVAEHLNTGDSGSCASKLGLCVEVIKNNFYSSSSTQQLHNRGMSFPTISASGPNSAVIHYEPSTETNRNITVNEIYLLDSGGQDGTTDITRTFHFGTPTDFQKVILTVLTTAHNYEHVS